MQKLDIPFTTDATPKVVADDIDENEHNENTNHVDTVRDIIIGMSDGLTVPFALAAGLAGAVSATHIIIVAGLAEIAAGSISMGLGGYLAAQSEGEHYKGMTKRQLLSLKKNPERKVAQTIAVFAEHGLSATDSAPAINSFTKNHRSWVKFLMQFKYHLEEPDPKRAVVSGLTIATAYIIGGSVPLAPYFFFAEPHKALLVSMGVTLVALIIFGYLKAYFMRVDITESVIRTAALGSIAAGAAYLIARLIS